MFSSFINFFLRQRVISLSIMGLIILWGLAVSPFNWKPDWLPSDPVSVDAIPDLGENQQIIYASWPGRSPQDMEDQVSYPLTSALLGIPGIKTIRSNSIFGLTTIYIIFEEDIEFYWSRTRIMEKFNSLPPNTLPEGVSPALGPDATALGQVFWYTLEGRDPETGKATGGWDPHELRTFQDYYLKFALSSTKGVAEVASIGGHVKEYQVDVDPLLLAQYDLKIEQIMDAVRKSNEDVGARTMEFNKAEYMIRGLGYVRGISDIENSVIIARNNVPVRIKDVAHVSIGPSSRRGGLDKEGAEATGAVIVARYGSNPMEVINNIKSRIAEIEPGLPDKILADGTTSKVTIVPFYDRSGLINETIGTLEQALTHEILIALLVVVVLVLNIRSSLVISGALPLAVLATFIVMKYAGVEANIVALSGIAIAIGVMVDVGIVIVENILREKELEQNAGIPFDEVVKKAVLDVSPAILTALATTIISFLPVFFLESAEGKLFRPLAFTKTFALVSSLFVGLIIIPTITYYVFQFNNNIRWKRIVFSAFTLIAAVLSFSISEIWLGSGLLIFASTGMMVSFKPEWEKLRQWINTVNIIMVIAFYLAELWSPLGSYSGFFGNFFFVIFLIAAILGVLVLVIKTYRGFLQWALDHKLKFLLIPLSMLFFGALSWLGFETVFSPMGKLSLSVSESGFWKWGEKQFPGLGREFMPSLDEGTFLLMPTTMTHAGVEENVEIIKKVDSYLSTIPEVNQVVGKWGRANSALDPAPISMFENTINYKTEYLLDENGRRMRFATDETGAFLLKEGGAYAAEKDGYVDITAEQLVPDRSGKYFRQWRPEIHSRDDIWKEIVKSTNIPGLTSAPKLQPIETRLVMLSTGMRASMGIKVFGPDLQSIEKAGTEMESIVKGVEGVEPASVFADRIVGKPYLEIELDRLEMSRFGLKVADVQQMIEVMIGGKNMTQAIDGRERIPVRLRFARDFRESPEKLEKLLIPTPSGSNVPLGEIAKIIYKKGPQMIRTEDTFLTSYVIFDKKEGFAEVNVVENVKEAIDKHVQNGDLFLPAGVSYRFTGSYENQLRSSKRLSFLIPACLLLIILILYFQFNSFPFAMLVFSGVFVAFSGGFIMLWLYGQNWFMNFNVAGLNMRDLFDMHTINISVAVWVGFIALFGIATDDGVLMGTYIRQVFKDRKFQTKEEIRSAVMEAGLKRVRPAIMTTATTLIALIPVLASTGKGSDILVPMAIPAFGGMVFQIITMFIVPVLFAAWQEFKLKRIKP